LRLGFVQRNFSCREKNELMPIPERMTDTEILWAIRYLDPDPCAERTSEDSGTLLGICITLLTGLTGAITYICLYIRNL
jgi:hypothetical protein